MHRYFALCFLLLLGGTFPTSHLAAQVQTEWVASYNRPGTLESRSEASALAVDSQGYVYVTGRSWGGPTNWDYVTIKYDAQGQTVWAVAYNGPGNGPDEPHALAVDTDGNVYVTGQSAGVDFIDEYATIKYSADGETVWVARYRGPAYGHSSAQALAVDDQGNVYVTGVSWGVDTFQDYTTIKYDAQGQPLWVARYDGPAHDRDEPRALAVDVLGYVYVTGASWGMGTLQDYATILYDPDGNQLWVARYDGPGSLTDEPRALAVDAQGNVYVTGASWGLGTQYDYATIKYDAGGNQLWVARYDGPDSDRDMANALAVDAEGNVYVTGFSGDAGYHYATVKYSADGEELWVARYEGPAHDLDVALALALDDQGQVYVTGHSQGLSVPAAYATVKYDPSGQQLWVARYHGSGADWNEARALAVDADGHVYVTGYGCARSGPGGSDDMAYCMAKDYSYITIKYTQE